MTAASGREVAPAPRDATPGAAGGIVGWARQRPAAAHLAVLAGLVLVVAGWYAWLGAGLFLDDWRLISDTQQYGTFHSLRHTDPGIRISRPVAWVLYNVVYRLAGASALRLLVMVTVLNLVVVVLLYLVMARIVTRSSAFLVTAVWVLLPTHAALTVWGNVVQALLSLVLLLGGVLWLTRGRWLVPALCFAAAALCYQVVIPMAALAAVATPVDGGLPARDRAKILAAIVLTSIWAALHPTYPAEVHLPDVAHLWRGHFGSGLFASADPPTLLRSGLALAVLAGTVVCCVAWWRGDRRSGEGPALVVLGLVVWVAGLVVLVTTPRWVQAGEFGLTTRVFGLSSMGSAMILVGIGQFVWRRSPPLGALGAVVLLVVAVSGQHVALVTWSDAARDARVLLTALGHHADDPADTHFLVGPDYPVRNSVLALEADSVGYAQQVYYGPGAGTVVFYDDPLTPLTADRVVLPWSVVSDDLPARFYEPVGRLDTAAATPAGLAVTGWVLDRSTADPIGVEVFVDDLSEPVATIASADRPRPELVDRYGLGAGHGFDEVLTDVSPAPGDHRVCMRGVTPRRAAEVPQLQCVVVTVDL